MSSSTYRVEILSTDARSRCDAEVEVRDSGDITLRTAEFELHEAGEDVLEAFCRIRVRLEELGLRPICYAAALNVYPSGMTRSMGSGVKAYRLTMGVPGRLADLVDIFDTNPGVRAVTVAEQRAYFQRWCESLESAR